MVILLHGGKNWVFLSGTPGYGVWSVIFIIAIQDKQVKLHIYVFIMR